MNVTHREEYTRTDHTESRSVHIPTGTITIKPITKDTHFPETWTITIPTGQDHDEEIACGTHAETIQALNEFITDAQAALTALSNRQEYP